MGFLYNVDFFDFFLDNVFIVHYKEAMETKNTANSFTLKDFTPQSFEQAFAVENPQDIAQIDANVEHFLSILDEITLQTPENATDKRALVFLDRNHENILHFAETLKKKKAMDVQTFGQIYTNMKTLTLRQIKKYKSIEETKIKSVESLAGAINQEAMKNAFNPNVNDKPNVDLT